MNEFIIVFRETLEAALIVGIIATFIIKIGDKSGLKTICQATGAAIVGSLLFAWGLIQIKEVAGSTVYEKLVEGLLMYLAAGFLIYMIIWMARNVNIKKELEEKAAVSLDRQGRKGIFFLVFFAISREGFETALFLIGGTAETSFSYLGFFSGMLIAVAVGWLIFVQGKRVPLKSFFNVTSLLLIFFAAGMVAYGTHEMEEFMVKTDMLNKESVVKVWKILTPVEELPENANAAYYTFNQEKGMYHHIFHDKGSIGSFLKGFFGYNSDPNPVELGLWFITLLGSFFFWNKVRRQTV